MRCSNCTVSVLSNRLRHHGASKNSRAADGMNAAVDIRPGVVDLAGAQARDQRAEIKLHEGQRHQRHAGDLQPRRCRERRPLRQPAQRPDDRRKDQQRQHQMGGQTILRDFDPLRQPRGHHPPADRALQRAEAEDQPQPPPQIRAQQRRATGTRETAADRRSPITRPSSRWLHSHQKIVLNSASVMPALSSRYCGIVL